MIKCWCLRKERSRRRSLTVSPAVCRQGEKHRHEPLSIRLWQSNMAKLEAWSTGQSLELMAEFVSSHFFNRLERNWIQPHERLCRIGAMPLTFATACLLK